MELSIHRGTALTRKSVLDEALVAHYNYQPIDASRLNDEEFEKFALCIEDAGSFSLKIHCFLRDIFIPRIK